MNLLQIHEPGETPLPHEDSVAVGIDLGTTHSVVALASGGQATVLRDICGGVLVPSVVHYAEDGRATVGKDAVAKLVQGAPGVVKSVKRLMGRGVADARALGAYALDETAQEGLVRVSLGGISRTPVEISADILRHLRRLAESALGKQVTKAVITVPAYFDDAARAATKDAAKLAGLDVLRLINEPTAAALAYGLDNAAEGIYAVYDLGGGTFDISILKMEKGVFRVLATGGDTQLGGDDFDAALADAVLAKNKVAKASLSHEAYQQVVHKARAAKEALSGKDTVEETWTIVLSQQKKYMAFCATAPEGRNPPLPPGEGRGEGTRSPKLSMDEILLSRVRDLRRNATDAEKLLWSILRNRQLGGFKFRRQHPIKPYIADFLNEEVKLIIELDGGQHAQDMQQSKDEKRTKFLEHKGYHVLRFWNNDVLQNIEAVIETIFEALSVQDPLPHPGPLPKGEGEEGGVLASHEDDHRTASQELRIKCSFTRDELDALMLTAVERSIRICAQVLADAGLAPREVKGVVLAGGSTRIPLVRKKVEAFFGAQPLADVNPDEVVAVGAALQAEGLTRGSDNLLLDVVPLSLGLETMGELVEKIIHRNTPIPVAAAQEFTTYQDGQGGMVIHVVQGEREMVGQCRSLARFELSGIPPMVAGLARVKVTFTVDADGLLAVSAREETTGAEQSVAVKPSYGLPPEEMERMLLVSMQHAKEDILLRLLAEARMEAQRSILELESAAARDAALLAPGEAEAFAKQTAVLREAMRGTERDLIDHETQHLGAICRPFAERRMNKAIEKALQGKKVEEV